jgi:hypothetical protein
MTIKLRSARPLRDECKQVGRKPPLSEAKFHLAVVDAIASTTVLLAIRVYVGSIPPILRGWGPGAERPRSQAIGSLVQILVGSPHGTSLSSPSNTVIAFLARIGLRCPTESGVIKVWISQNDLRYSMIIVIHEFLEISTPRLLVHLFPEGRTLSCCTVSLTTSKIVVLSKAY